MKTEMKIERRTEIVHNVEHGSVCHCIAVFGKEQLGLGMGMGMHWINGMILDTYMGKCGMGWDER